MSITRGAITRRDVNRGALRALGGEALLQRAAIAPDRGATVGPAARKAMGLARRRTRRT